MSLSCLFGHKWSDWERENRPWLWGRRCIRCGFVEKTIFMNMTGPPRPQPPFFKRCWFFHDWGNWREMERPHNGCRNILYCKSCGKWQEK